MASFDIDWVDERYPSLDRFAAEDGCSRIYKVTSSKDGDFTNYYTIRRPTDEDALYESFYYRAVVVWPPSDSGLEKLTARGAALLSPPTRAAAPLARAATTPVTSPKAINYVLCRYCGEAKKESSTQCPSCHFMDWVAVIGASVFMIAIAGVTGFWFSSKGWIIGGWIATGLVLIGLVNTCVTNLKVIRRFRAREASAAAVVTKDLNERPVEAPDLEKAQVFTDNGASSATSPPTETTRQLAAPSPRPDEPDTLLELQRKLTRSCCDYDDGSGQVTVKIAVNFFDQLNLARIKPLLVKAEIREVNTFVSILDRISSHFQEPCDSLEQLRSTILDAKQDALRAEAEKLATATKVGSIFRVLVQNCFPHDDASGLAATWQLPLLLASVSSEHVSLAVAQSSAKSVAALTKLLGGLARDMRDPSEEFVNFREAIAKGVRTHVPTAQNVEYLQAHVTGLCCKHDDGSGGTRIDLVRAVLDGVDFSGLGRSLSECPIRQLNRFAEVLQRMSRQMRADAPQGFAALVDAVNTAIDLAAAEMRPKILAASDLTLRRVLLIQACCGHDDASGFFSDRAFDAMLGISAQDRPPGNLLKPEKKEALRKLLESLNAPLQ